MREKRVPDHQHQGAGDGGWLDAAALHARGAVPSVTTITTSTGAANLSELADVNVVSTPPADNDALTYDAASGKWVPEAVSGGASFATPAIVLGTAAAAGAASTVIRSDSTIVAFDATVPVTQAFGDSAATGSAAVAARRDHKHGMPSAGSTIVVKDEGSTLTTDATTLDFVGAGVTASGTGATKTITISGGSGSLVLLEQHTASNSTTLDFTSFISATYDDYLFRIINLRPATDNVTLFLRMGTGGTPTYDTGNNYHWSSFRESNSGAAAAGDTAGARMLLDGNGGIDNGADSTFSGHLSLYDPSSALYKRVTWQGGYVDNAGAPLGVTGSGRYMSATAVTAIRFMFSSGNITSGVIRVYGITKT